jgi:PepSY-associated TM region
MKILTRAFWARYSRSIHLSFAWFGGLALLIWGLSGVTHPIMSWTGPEAAKFFPPRLSADLPNLLSPLEVLQRANLKQATQVRVMASFDEPVLQVTETSTAPRRYFSLKTGAELLNRDQEQALWLAKYYTGLESAPISSVRLQTAFDADYPYVNRLLPVWRIEFNTPDQRRVFIYTELNALAAQHNTSRYMLQAVFQTLHTWSFLDGYANAQAVIIGGFMIALMGMAVTGTLMIFSFKRRPIPDGKRRWHRRIAYIIWLPIFALSSSGFFHLLQSHFGGVKLGMQSGAPMSLSAAQAAPLDVWRAAAGSGAANALSFVQGPEGLVIRVERPALQAMEPDPSAADPHAHHKPVTREERFKGKSTRGDVVYYNAVSGAVLPNYDTVMARHLAVTLGGAKPEDILAIEPITRFGMGYDFRNKRLPVWEVSLNDASKRSLFIDSGANFLVDQATQMQRIESWSFSTLHKWTFLPRAWQDASLVSLILLACGSAVAGFFMVFKQRRRPKRIQ